MAIVLTNELITQIIAGVGVVWTAFQEWRHSRDKKALLSLTTSK